MTRRMLAEVGWVAQQEKSDAVLVSSDKDSTLAGAPSAVVLHILVAHEEACLGGIDMATQDEINRILIARVSRWSLSPRCVAPTHLQRVGFSPEHFLPLGDFIYALSRIMVSANRRARASWPAGRCNLNAMCWPPYTASQIPTNPSAWPPL